MKNNLKIAVVIPCYKVAKHIEGVVKAIPSFVDFIILVDDFCPQKSGKVVEQLHLQNVTVIYHTKNKGVGGAVVSGYKKALELDADITVKVDGDGQMDPLDIHLLLDPIAHQTADYTKGNRFQDFSRLRSMPAIRLFGNSFLSFLIKFASGYWNLMDPTNGFTAISKEALKKLNLNKISKRFFFETDMLIRLNIHSVAITDVAISAKYDDEESNLNIIHVLLEFPFKIFKGLLRRIFYKYYIFNFNMASIYLLLSIPLLFFGFTFGMYRWIIGALEGIENTAGTIMLVALPIILGIQFLLQAIHIDISSIPKKGIR